MTLALFDLDNTLLVGDSDHLWGEFLIRKQLVDEAAHRAINDQYYRDYLDSTLDVGEYLNFAMAPVVGKTLTDAKELLDEYLAEVIPMIAPDTPALLEHHRSQGHTLVVITATNQILANGICRHLGIEHLIATRVKMDGDTIVGGLEGVANFQSGKIDNLERWAKTNIDWQSAYFYSDSHNDIPLLEKVGNPVAVDPDEQLRDWAIQQAVEIRSLR